MTDKPFVLLTQDNCPNCDRLKKMLAGPLKSQFHDQIEVIHRQMMPEWFEELTAQHGVRSTPALIRVTDGAQVRDPGSLGEVKGFLQAL